MKIPPSERSCNARLPGLRPEAAPNGAESSRRFWPAVSVSTLDSPQITVGTFRKGEKLVGGLASRRSPAHG